jgi:phosphatidylserine decarboxylase
MSSDHPSPTTAGNGRPSVRERLFVTLQYLLPHHFLSRLVLRVARIRIPVVKNTLISKFVSGFRPDMSEATQPDALQFASFNEFFTRTLRPQTRPVDWAPQVLVSPVDGTVSQIGRLDDSRLLQAKGHHYTLEALLAPPGAALSQQQWPDRFRDGSFATLYLAPYNYHRIHMPIAGTLRAAWYVPGRLFSVNAVTAAAVPNLFARNERVICLFENGPHVFAMVLVGALFVGSIATVWHGDITPLRPRRATQLPLDSSRMPLRLEKGAEMGRFNMGSTVILLTPPGMAQWLPAFAAGTRIRMGEGLARMNSPHTAP